MEDGADKIEKLLKVSVFRQSYENFATSKGSIRAIRTPESCMSLDSCKDSARRDHL